MREEFGSFGVIVLMIYSFPSVFWGIVLSTGIATVVESATAVIPGA
jgi:hypothetical protein